MDVESKACDKLSNVTVKCEEKSMINKTVIKVIMWNYSNNMLAHSILRGYFCTNNLQM